MPWKNCEGKGKTYISPIWCVFFFLSVICKRQFKNHLCELKLVVICTYSYNKTKKLHCNLNNVEQMIPQNKENTKKKKRKIVFFTYLPVCFPYSFIFSP